MSNDQPTPDVEHTAENDALDEALAEMGRQARSDEACSICHASIRPDRRDRHLDWHASLSREVERERLPQVFGTRLDLRAALTPEHREELTRALHRHTCGTDWDEWNQPCAWAGDDWDYDNGPNTCAYVGEVGVEDAIAPLLAVEHAAGAADLRARIEAVMEGWQDDKLHGVRYAHRCIWTALNGGE